jgi:hypothetical protein
MTDEGEWRGRGRYMRLIYHVSPQKKYHAVVREMYFTLCKLWWNRSEGARGRWREGEMREGNETYVLVRELYLINLCMLWGSKTTISVLACSRFFVSFFVFLFFFHLLLFFLLAC